jgi:hypothetical protein
MPYSFASFQDALARYLPVDPAADPDYPTLLPLVIEQAELRCYRELDFLATRRRSTGLALTAAMQTMALPADLVVLREFDIFTPAGTMTTRAPLARRSEAFLRDYWPTPANTGTPVYYALVDQATALLAPTPSGAFNLELAYTFRPAALSAANPQTWLAANCPDLFLYAALVAYAGFQKDFGAQSDDPRMALSWEQQFQTAKVSVIAEEARRKAEAMADANPVSASQPPPRQPQ